jgi:hypothetical protein
MTKVGASQKATDTGADTAQNDPGPHLPMTVQSTKWYAHFCDLTVKLTGRAEASAGRRRRTLSPGGPGAKQTTPHGPLQRLLGRTSEL